MNVIGMPSILVPRMHFVILGRKMTRCLEGEAASQIITNWMGFIAVSLNL